MRTVLWLTLATASRKADRNFVLPFEGISRCSFFASGGAAPSSSRHIATPASRRITVREERLVPDICNNPSRQVASLAGPLGAQKSLSLLAADHNLQRNNPLVAAHLEGDLIPRLLPAHEPAELLGTANPVIIKLKDDIARLQAGLGGGRIGRNLGNLAILGLLGEFHAQLCGLDDSALHAASPRLALGQPVPGLAIAIHRYVEIGRHEHADAAVNADHLAVEIKKRPAGVAPHHSAVRANERVIEPLDPADADDRAAAPAKPAGMADGHAPLALLEIGGFAHLGMRPCA